jgi:hypothetical protein
MHIVKPTTNAQDVKVLIKLVKTRSHPKMRTNGGCTPSLNSVTDLAKWMLMNNPNNWKEKFVLKVKHKTKNSCDIYEVMAELSPKFPYDGLIKLAMMIIWLLTYLTTTYACFTP